MYRQAVIQANIHVDNRQANKQIYIQGEGQAGRQTDIQAVR